MIRHWSGLQRQGYPMSRLRNIPQKGTVTEEQGFSLVELLVVLSLIGLVAGFVSTVYLFGQKAFNRWEKNMKLENELHTVLAGIAEDLYRAERIEEIDRQYVHLERADRGNHIYEIDARKIVRNGHELLKKGIYVSHFRMEYHSGYENGNHAAGLSTFNINEIRSIRIELGLTDTVDTLSSQRLVHLRNPAVWKPLHRDK